MAETRTGEEVWTTRRLLAWMSEHFRRRGVDAPRLSAELLLAHVLKTERLRLYMEVDRPATPEELTTLRSLVERAARHEPIAYLLGEAWFFGRPFHVTPATLIPRPSTETIVEHLLQHHRVEGPPQPLIVDIGTGSGILAVTLTAAIAEARALATDVSQAALEVAQRNATRHEVRERIDFRSGSLYEPLSGSNGLVEADFLVSNPPYISDAEWEEVAANIRDYEPHEALRAGADGLTFLRPLIAEAHRFLRPGGRLFFEIAASQREGALELARSNAQLIDAVVLHDHEGHPRILHARRSG